jgi:hypothetical protein
MNPAWLLELAGFGAYRVYDSENKGIRRSMK